MRPEYFRGIMQEVDDDQFIRSSVIKNQSTCLNVKCCCSFIQAKIMDELVSDQDECPYERSDGDDGRFPSGVLAGPQAF